MLVDVLGHRALARRLEAGIAPEVLPEIAHQRAPGARAEEAGGVRDVAAAALFDQGRGRR